jgi:hypothetical protein
MLAADWFRRTCDLTSVQTVRARPLDLVALAVSMREAAPGRLIYEANHQVSLRQHDSLTCVDSTDYPPDHLEIERCRGGVGGQQAISREFAKSGGA